MTNFFHIIFFLLLFFPCFSQSALRLQGSGQYIEIPHKAVYETDRLTIEFWMLSEGLNNDPAGEQTIVDKREPAKGYNIRLAGKNYPLPCFSFWDPQHEIHDIPGVEQYQWVHYAFVTRADSAWIYKNGVRVSERKAGFYDLRSKSPLRIGEFLGYPGATLPFIGQMDELRIWSVALQEKDIKGNMHKTLTGTESGLLLYLNFDNAANPAFDLSPNRNHGIRIGNVSVATPGAPVGYQPLPAPLGAYAYGASDAILLEWEVVSGATEYEVYRSESPSVALIAQNKLAVTTNRSYRDLNTQRGKKYYYKVVALNERKQAGLSTGILVGQQVSLMDFNTGVYYYPWYQPELNHHNWPGEYLRGRLVPQQLPVLGEYSCNNSSVIRQHLQWMEQSSIDYFISSWWGRESFEDKTLKSRILPELGQSKVKFAVYFESAIYASNTNGIEITDQNLPLWLQDMDYIADQYFNHPNYLRMNGRPVLYIYLSHIYTGKYKEAYAQLRQRLKNKGHDVFIVGDFDLYAPYDKDRHDVLDALSPYIAIPAGHRYTNGQTFPHDYDFLRNMALAMEDKAAKIKSHGKLFIPNVYPGFNNRVVSLQTGFLVPRQLSKRHTHYSLYEGMIKLARTFSDPEQKMVTITSWNEWHEDTSIEPVISAAPNSRDNSSNGASYSLNYPYEGYGYTLLNLTKELLGNGAVSETTQKFLQKQRLSLQPNPTTEVLYIKHLVDDVPSVHAYQIMDAQGRLVLYGKIAESEGIDVHMLPAGIYCLRMDTQIGTYKFVKM